MRILSIVIFGIIVSTSVYAGTYSGLVPGSSTKFDADKVLGAPIKEVIRVQRYDYNPEDHDASRLSLTFNARTQVIETITLYFKQSYTAPQVKQWFELSEVPQKEIDDDGNLIEYYLSDGIALFYEGPDTESDVTMLSFFDAALLQKQEVAMNPESKYEEVVTSKEQPSWLRPGQKMGRVVSPQTNKSRYSSSTPEPVPQRSGDDWEQRAIQNEARQKAKADQELYDASYKVGQRLGQLLLGKAAKEVQQSSGAPSEPTVFTEAETDWDAIYAEGTGSRSSGSSRSQRPADAIFYDDFENENGGRGSLNYNQLRNWQVVGGTVDLIGNKFWDYFPQNGLHIDLDGSTNNSGTLQSKTLRLEPGTYQLQFDLAGNPMSGPDTVIVTFESLFSERITLQHKEPFQTITRTISVSAPTEAKLEFQDTGNDNQGIFLDNVLLR